MSNSDEKMTYEMYIQSDSKEVQHTIAHQTPVVIRIQKDGKHRTISEEYLNATPTTKSVLECFYENYLKEKNLIPFQRPPPPQHPL